MFANYFNKLPMHIFYGKAALIVHLKSIRKNYSTVGFVPTMGALHLGHLSLIEKSMANNTTTVVSIFVNPTQFTNREDLEQYPRTLESDLQKIVSLSENIIVYAPTDTDIYDGEIVSEKFNFDGLENQMEGKFRPGHFNGVGTIVKRLFEIINPTNAYFGEKDFQQLQIIKKLVAKNKISINVVGCPIYRESNQLAMSSRNELLSLKEKQEAAIIYKTLYESRENFKKMSAKMVVDQVEKVFQNQPNFALEYYQIADEESLLPCIRKSKKKKYRAFIAVFMKNIRLIDTISLK